MTNKEAIRILGLECDEWDVSHCTASERREAFGMAITALQVQDKLQDIEHMCRLSGGADYFRVFAALLEKENNSNDKVNNSNATQSNGIENRVKSMTACRVPEDDCISRQAAKHELYKMLHDCFWADDEEQDAVAVTLDNLPSVQPETAKRIVGKSRNGMTLWYQCDMCNEPVDAQDIFCRGCGRRLTDE